MMCNVAARTWHGFGKSLSYMLYHCCVLIPIDFRALRAASQRGMRDGTKHGGRCCDGWKVGAGKPAAGAGDDG